MQEIASTRFSVSYHLKDLLKRDPQKVKEIAKWLETKAETSRDRLRRTSSRRMMARLIAARQLLRATEDTATSESVMNRTEGKVAEKVETETRHVHLHFNVTPATPSISGHTPGTHTSQLIDNTGNVINALDQQSSVEDPEACTIHGPIRHTEGERSQESAGGEDQVPMRVPDTSSKDSK